MEFHPVTSDRWSDVEALFGPRGACGGCWCMTWRLSSSEYEQEKGPGNRASFERIVKSGLEPGILAYEDGQPIGWCAVAPRSEFPRLERSRILKPVDDTPVWSIVCLFVRKSHRSRGVGTALIRAAVSFAASNGAEVVEGYPVEPKKDHMPDVFAFTGIASSFLAAGFHEVARRSDTRPIMRFEVADSPALGAA